MTFPVAFEQRLRSDFPNLAEDILKTLDQPKEKETFRINPEKCTLQDLDVLIPDSSRQNILWSKVAFSTKNKRAYSKNPLVFTGLYYFQSLSSILPVHILNPLPGDGVLDACASPGSKSTQILGALQGQGFLVANEIDKTRVGRLVQNISEWGAKNVWITQQDTKSFLSLEGTFDKILVDAPCTGEGTFYKDPLALKLWNPKRGEQCARLQKQILENLLPTLKAGGELVYSTCTLSIEENEKVVDWVLSKYEDCIELVSFSDFWEGGEKGFELLSSPWGSEIAQKTRRIFPFHKDFEGEGFFLAKFRVSKPIKTKRKSFSPKRQYREILSIPEKMLRVFWQDMGWKHPMKVQNLLTLGHSLYMYSHWDKAFVRLLLETLRPIYVGCRLGTVKDKWISPTYEWVLQREWLSPEILVDLSDEEVHLYCLGISQPILGVERIGFVAVSYKGIPLGIGKILKDSVLRSYFSPTAGRKVFSE